MTRVCQYLNISRQAWYKWTANQRQKEKDEEKILSFVQYQRIQHPRIGTRKLHKMLCQAKAPDIGRDKLFTLLKKHRMLVPVKRAYHKTTHSFHRFYCHPNLLKPGESQVIPNRPEHVWVADITYLPVIEGEAYLSLVTDAWSRKIVGYHVDDNLRAESVLKAYKRALKRRTSTGVLIHHSDRGLQYCSRIYQELHREHGVRCSMTDGYDCYQNAMAERVNGIIKNEYLLTKPKNIEEARSMVVESITIYNQKRPHMALKYKTPDEIHQAF